MKPNQHTYMPGPMQEQLIGDPVQVCEVCCYPQVHANHQMAPVPPDFKQLLGELFVVMQREIEAQHVWMTPERDWLMVRCATALGRSVR